VGPALVFTHGAAIVGAYYYFYEQRGRPHFAAELAAIRAASLRAWGRRVLPEFRAQVGELEGGSRAWAILPEERTWPTARRLQTLRSRT
jgi:hypothetical protein